jgi:hypothetical protein
LLPDDIDDFTIRSSVDVDGAQILETMQSSKPLLIHQISPGDNVKSGIASVDPSDETLSHEFLCSDDYFDAPEDQICFTLCLGHNVIETFDPYRAERPVNVQIMPRILGDHEMLPFHYIGHFFRQITLSGPFMPVVTLLCRVL